MNRDDIIRMAREAGGHEGDQCEVCGETHALWMFGLEELEHIAALVAAAEREACAKVCDDLEPDDRHEGAWIAGWCDGTDDCAAAIRARSTL